MSRFVASCPENYLDLMCRGSVLHGTILTEKSNKMQQCIKILLFHIYMKLNMFRTTHRPSSGAKNCTGSIWFCIRGRLPDV